MDTMFGDAIGGWKLVLAGFVVIVLMAVFFWGLRRFGGDRLNNSAARGRQPRLAVIDAATVDGRRRLVLIRRDNVEHLLIIGGPTDVVVEQNIVRSTPAAREGAPARPAAATDALPRAVPLGEGTMWPLQPEPAPAPRLEPAPRPEPPTPRVDATQRLDPTPRLEPTSRLEPAARLEPAPRPEPRPQRAPPVAEQRSPIAAEQRLPSISEQRAPPVMEEQIEWSAEAEQAAPPPPPPGPRERRPRTVDPLAGLAEELSRVPPQSEPSDHEPPPPPRQMEPPPPLRPMEPPPRREPPARREPRAPRPQPAPPAPPVQAAPPPPPAPEPQFTSSADQNLAEMAQRLEAALRRPPQSGDAPAPRGDGVRAPAPRTAQSPAHQSAPEPMGDDEMEAAPPPRPPVPAEPARREPRPARADPRAAAAPPQRSLYDSLEQEMASLLGRPNTKP